MKAFLSQHFDKRKEEEGKNRKWDTMKGEKGEGEGLETEVENVLNSTNSQKIIKFSN